MEMGIGSGYCVNGSGEEVAIRLLSTGPAQHGICVFDVGANAGQFLKLLKASLDGEDLQIHSFEPSSHAFRALAQRFGVERNVQLNNFALGRENSTATLFFNTDGSELASLTKRNLAHLEIDFERSESVEVRRLDDYCFRNSIAKIDLLKIDVEGHELDVLAGAEGLFEKQAVKYVMFEFGGCNIDTRTYMRDYWNFFQKLQMVNLWRLTPSGYLARIDKYREDLEQFRTSNYLVELPVKG